MADIHSYPFLRHLRGAPTSYIRHTQNGHVLHQGVAQSFWFRPLSAVLSEVPVDDRDLPLIFHARTADYQDVVVQATVSYRIAEPPRAAERIDFGIDPQSGKWRSTPLETLASLVMELAQQHALELLARLHLAEGRERGYFLEQDEQELGVTSVAVPLVGLLQPVAVSISAPSCRVEIQTVPGIGRKMRARADAFTRSSLAARHG